MSSRPKSDSSWSKQGGEPLQEIPLLGGQLTPDIVRVGKTVRRPSKGNAAFVRELLLFLEEQGYSWANQTAEEQARRIRLMCEAYGWEDPIALVDDFEADLQQALRNHEQAGRVGAIKVFQEEVSWMRVRAQELRLVLR
jgi:hypothetical protein